MVLGNRSHFPTDLAGVLLLMTLGGCADRPTEPGASVRTVRVLPAADTVFPGGTVSFSASALNAAGAPVRGVAFSWSSSDPIVATVGDSGTVQARGVGTAMITAAAAGIAGHATVRVVTAVEACALGGTDHAGAVGSETWTAAASPHRVRDSISVTGTLAVEAGALVCAGAQAQLTFQPGAALIARGTAARQILFTAMNPIAPWSLSLAPVTIGPGATAELRHVRLDRADLLANGSFVLDSSRADRVGIQCVGCTGRITASVLDSGGVHLAGFNHAVDLTLEGDSIVGEVSCTGMFSPTAALLRLRRTRITGAPVGLVFDYRHPCTLVEAEGVRLTGNGYPADLDVTSAMLLLAQSGGGDSLRGNVEDEIAFNRDGTLAGDAVLPALGYVVKGEIAIQGSGTLRIEPGVHITLMGTLLESDPSLTLGARVLAEGTADRPITFESWFPIDGSEPMMRHEPQVVFAAGTSVLTHAELSGLNVIVQTPMALDAIHLSGGGTVALNAPGSALLHSLVEEAASAFADAAVTLAADNQRVHGTIVRRSGLRSSRGHSPNGIRVSGRAAVLDSCEIAQNAGTGIVVQGGADASIHESNIVNNGGLGVDNGSSDVVDARRNWWGDPAGPNGPAGDRVSAGVDWQPPLAAPVPLAITATAADVVARRRRPPGPAAPLTRR